MKIGEYFRNKNPGRFINNSKEHSVLFIIYQICCLQTLYYTLYSFTVFVVFTLWSIPRNLSYLFNTRSYFEEDIGLYSLCVLNFLNSLIMPFFVKAVVHRTKKCLDFVLSYNIIHFILSTLISGFPTSYGWYVILFVCITVSVVLSEYLCYNDEIREIELVPFSDR